MPTIGLLRNKLTDFNANTLTPFDNRNNDDYDQYLLSNDYYDWDLLNGEPIKVDGEGSFRRLGSEEFDDDDEDEDDDEFDEYDLFDDYDFTQNEDLRWGARTQTGGAKRIVCVPAIK